MPVHCWFRGRITGNAVVLTQVDCKGPITLQVILDSPNFVYFVGFSWFFFIFLDKKIDSPLQIVC